MMKQIGLPATRSMEYPSGLLDKKAALQAVIELAENLRTEKRYIVTGWDFLQKAA